MATTPSRAGHLPINGLSLYYEVHGELGTSRTSPLLLIPGAFMSTDSMTSWVSAFAGGRAVIVFDQQGHGRTPDISRGMSYEQFPDDAAMLLRALKVERADVMGYSNGGGVARRSGRRRSPGESDRIGCAALSSGRSPMGRGVDRSPHP
jgi:pimeloyl-ACP methyl ester carboxylesterase